MQLPITFFLIVALKFSIASRILFVAPIPSYSHQVFYRKIWLELSQRGHEITVLTTDVLKNAPKNVRQIDWNFSYDIRHVKHNISKATMDSENNIFKLINNYKDMLLDIADQELGHPDVQKLLHDDKERFDLVIVEYHYPVYFGFAHHFNCPYIGISSGEVSSHVHEIFNNPTHPLLYPWMLQAPPKDWSLLSRFKVASSSLLTTIVGMFFYSHHESDLVTKHFGPNYPSLAEMTRNASLVLYNMHIVFDTRPLSPAVIRIGGATHLEPIKDLPKDLKQFLDASPEGVVYFSLGTNVRSDCIKKELLKVFIETFEELPYKVLWKFDAQVEVPQNVKVVNWVPQQDVLRHKNIKLFITQGGLQSLDEAIMSMIPMVVIPFVSDQKLNAYKIETKGLGIQLDHKTLDKITFKNAILEIIGNPRYYETITKTAQYLQDQPMSGLDTAVWWIEYVLRHKGTKHLFDYQQQLPFYQYYMLDIMALSLTILFGIIYLLKLIFKIIISLLYKLFTNKNTIKQHAD